LQAKSRVFFRADGSSKIGLGHVIRSLALAEMIEGEFDCSFIIREPLQYLKNQIGKVCANIIELAETTCYTEEAVQISEKFLKSSDIVVLDGYHFNTEYQSILKAKGCYLICIDDIHT